MSKYYHFTEYKYLESINQNGLVPKNNTRSISVGDNRNAIFLSRDKLSTILMFLSVIDAYKAYSGENGQKKLAQANYVINRYEETLKNSRKKGLDIFGRAKALKAEYEEALYLKQRIENMSQYHSFEEYWGEGVYLSVDDIPDVKYINSDFHNCWVEESIQPENINVVTLKDKETGEIVDSKQSIIHYLMASVTPEDLFCEYKNTIGIYDDRYECHAMLKSLDDYYLSHKNEFNELKEKYELVEVPIQEYMKTFSYNGPKKR